MGGKLGTHAVRLQERLRRQRDAPDDGLTIIDRAASTASMERSVLCALDASIGDARLDASHCKNDKIVIYRRRHRCGI